MPQPLAGIRVVEFSHMLMGPSCGLVLADLGAEVVKVEPMPDGDKTRRLTGSGAGFFVAFNRNKQSVALDLKTPEGLEFARRLIATSDVLIENFRPGALDGLGLGYEAAAAINPRLVYCSLKGFLAGPYEKRAALDEVVQMMGGLAYMTGPPGRPLRAGASVNDIMGGMFAAIGILAALLERSHTGTGRHVRSALFENNVFLVAQHMAQFMVTGHPAAPMPARLAAWAVYDIFETHDQRQIFVGVVTNTQWVKFCEAFEIPDLGHDPSLATNTQRVEARDRILPVIREVFAKLDFNDALAACEHVGLPYAPITRPEELYQDPHLMFPGAMIPTRIGDGRTIGVPALPIDMDGERFGLRLDPPRPGEHGRALAARLGYAPEEITALLAAGILGKPQEDETQDDKAHAEPS